MAWVAVDCDFFEHEKTLELMRACGGRAALALLRLWLWAGKHAPTGGLGEVDVEWIAGWRDERGAFLGALQAVGFLERRPGGWWLHHWAERQPHLAEQGERTASATKAANARWSQRRTALKPTRPPSKEAAAFAEWLMGRWNEILVPLGFAEVRAMTDVRVRHVAAAMRDYGKEKSVWERALRAYGDDARRWPERTEFGLDTFLRPSVRGKWLERPAGPAKAALPFDGLEVE